MAETIHVRGEGGAVFTMDLPLPEGIADRLAKGLLVRVNEDGSPHHGGPVPAATAPGADGPDARGGGEPAPSVARPAQAAPKSEWIAHVVRRGLLSADDAANYTKADLIDMVN
ncbi:hypothetical protein IGX29_04960 [Streptomyces sp. H28]|uniref:hypothetical protein n=1 Tax=unclassified Streptomyces TaxID=2593676 RepID=UPI00177C198B|nr:hypothetical protein [Streptomyces sp. H28]MBD9731176.1 hypothetical protein [Streptomyces sp. H28]